mgnify:CR=1 FL=1
MSKYFYYSGWSASLAFAKELGWKKEPEFDDNYLDSGGCLDQGKALNDMHDFIESNGWEVHYE